MKNFLNQALILCGGKGERLKPITDSIPKPLVIIDKEPILGHQIKYLEKKGIKDFVIATGYKSRLIKDYLNRSFTQLKFKIVDSGNVDIMLRIHDCKTYLNDEFLVCYGDTLADIDISNLYKFHNNHDGKATVSTYQLQSQFGIIKTNRSGLVMEFLEKPKLDAWINIGYFIFKKTVIDIEATSFAEFIAHLAESGHLYSYKHKGIHITVNTMIELKQAKIEIKYFNGKKI